MNKSIFSIFTVLLLIVSSLLVFPSSSSLIEMTSTGGILCVGGSGPGNYTSIQDAIDNATSDDTVFVEAE